MNKPRPTRSELQAAEGKTVADIIAPGLKILFCGINPGLYSAAIGHHFGRPGNRFWPTLHLSGLTPRLLTPYQERELLTFGFGITNVVSRATAGAAELTPAELAEGGRRLAEKVADFRPHFLAVLGIGAYRAAFARPEAVLGRQPETLAETVIWALPNPSGLNAHYDLQGLAGLFAELRQAAESET